MRDLGVAALASAGVGDDRGACATGAASSLIPGDDSIRLILGSCECVSAFAAERSPPDKGVGLREVASAGPALVKQCGGRIEVLVAAGGIASFRPASTLSMFAIFSATRNVSRKSINCACRALVHRFI